MAVNPETKRPKIRKLIEERNLYDDAGFVKATELRFADGEIIRTGDWPIQKFAKLPAESIPKTPLANRQPATAR